MTPAFISPFAADCKTVYPTLGAVFQSSPLFNLLKVSYDVANYVIQTPAIDTQVKKTKGKWFAGKMFLFSALDAHFWHPNGTRLHNILKIMLTACLLTAFSAVTRPQHCSDASSSCLSVHLVGLATFDSL